MDSRDEEKIIELFLAVYSSHENDSIKTKQMFAKFDSKYVSSVFESILNSIFDTSLCHEQLKKISEDLFNNNNLNLFYNSIKVLYASGCFSVNINYLVGLFMEKKDFIQTFLLEYFTEMTGFKIERNISDQILEDLIEFYLGYKASFSFTRLKEFQLRSIKIDMTKEISDANSFFIDGFSLVAQCFQSHDVDWSSGGQYLHLVYLFEKYIEMFSCLTEYYYIIFFKDFNALFINNSSFYLAVNVIYNHLTTLGKIKLKIKFFKSILDEEYIDFLCEERPTFMVINDNNIHDLCNSYTIRKELKSAYNIFKIYHANHEINFMLLDELIIKSNRLNGFYSTHNYGETKKMFKTLVKLEFEKDFEKIIDHQTEFISLWKLFDKSLIRKSSENIKQLKKKVGSKLTLYCTTLAWCYTNNKHISDKLYGSLAFSMIVQCYLQANLDLKLRALRIKSTNNYDENMTSFLDNFKGFLAYLIQCKSFSQIVMSPNEMCDILDGRLFKFCFNMSKLPEMDRFWQKLFHIESFYLLLNNCFHYLRLILESLSVSKENSEFLQMTDLGTSEASPEELYKLFKDFNLHNQNQTDFELLCFNGKQKLTAIQINKSNHDLFKSLVKELNCNFQHCGDDSSLFKNALEKFVSDYKWNDTFNTYKSKIKSKLIDDDSKNSENIIEKLNIFSIKMSNQVVKKKILSLNEFKNISNDIEAKNYWEALEIVKNFEETHDQVYLNLKVLFEIFQNEDLCIQDKKEFIVDLLVTADNLWRKLLSENFEKLKKDSISLILTVLASFGLFEIESEVFKIAKKKLDFTSDQITTKVKYKLPETPRVFQMVYLSDFLIKEKDTVYDPRTKIFAPDRWQIDFMNIIDKNESILIIAPTSSGKTFASFYAMEKVLKSSDPDSVLVYVSPTKALVNQTAYAIMDKFENYKLCENKNLCGIFTRDFQNNLLDSKILVTVPECFAILILNIAHSKWMKNIHYVVFDEIHTMGGEKDVWEHLILLTSFPYIALSATISNANNLYNWLNKLENSRLTHNQKRKVRLIKYSIRHNDLKKFIYTSEEFKTIHPVSCLNISTVKKHDSLPSDLHLSAKQAFQLYDAIKSFYPDDDDVLSLNPENTDLLKIKPLESLFITKNSVRAYETELKSVFLNFVTHGLTKKAKGILKHLEMKFQSGETYPRYLQYFKRNNNNTNKISPKIQSFIDLVLDIHKEDMLPCIIFTNNRVLCEKYANELANFLKESNISILNNKVEDGKLNEIYNQLGSEEIPFMIKMGVGWHHSGLSKNKKAITEALFRIGKIRIILATATLALGVHMPCKTVVFMDDSIHLDSFQYRQASGRAGRRGFDQNGNVVFFDIPLIKLKRLVGSFIPEIRPHFPLSVTFSMNFFDSEFRKKYVSTSVDCLLNKSFWNFTFRSKISQVLYDAVFSLNFLMSLQLINDNGKFSLFTNLLERIHYHEPSNFLLYYLFISGNFHEIIKKRNLERYMLIICHLFNQQPMKNGKRALPKLSSNEETKINEYNNFVLQSFTNFFIHLGSKLKENYTKDLNVLPLSNLTYTKEENQNEEFFKTNLKKWSYDYSLVSPFAALSGIQDNQLFSVKCDLFFNCLSILHIDSKILPIFTRSDFLNDYAFKFFLSDDYLEENLEELEKDGILIGDLVNLLKDFSIILISISNCISKIAPENDLVNLNFKTLSETFNQKFKLFTEKMIKFDKI